LNDAPIGEHCLESDQVLADRSIPKTARAAQVSVQQLVDRQPVSMRRINR